MQIVHCSGPSGEIKKTVLDPLSDGISSVELMRVSGSDLDVVNAARVSFGKWSDRFDERDQKLINFLMLHDHTSPFEHNQLSFRIKAPIFVARQWMRHRMNSYNEISYRYAKAPLEFYVPACWRGQDAENKQASAASFEDESLKKKYQDLIDHSVKAYNELLDAGVVRELARGVLPVTIYTQFMFTCNLHSLFHFLKLRSHEGAQWEIRQYAQALKELAEEYFPASFRAWHLKLKG
ncbi:TPA: FAD-dependent thymidylate synthase [Candidatus Dependentiae bacterium]|nr:MAG: Thymidylate synthase ThyX [candidate division TM6 bacterium GW2011_GWF2_36_131]KKQ03829.1 MAG: Thymidylate synthase ThyX [candidate division TM6 bacterium GW2011_GWE2_36_25]KKQ19975.1 MAG: Thymidylate synthase ThyX [candidate division TM6 bacterium GW2011_GWA2_36_9]HBR70597.1 FAD-dependent thymidylate synthase [Candidatus Dependentiae bacterium]HCU00688.1 FAD-dependent thymidylate synthase [Candidatus Dependentiae bacterium]